MYDGKPKYGNPRSEAERRRRHKAKYGKNAKLPKRGSGKRGESATAQAIREKK